jgi:integrase
MSEQSGNAEDKKIPSPKSHWDVASSKKMRAEEEHSFQIGCHTFRHSYRSWLESVGARIRVQKGLCAVSRQQ